MCRLYASLGGHGPPVEELEAFRAQCTESSCGPHTDGWGIVGFPSPGTPRYLGRAPVAAQTDPAWGKAAEQAARHPVVLAHLRAASVGGRTLENTHPFVQGPWAFAHNGTIRGGYEAQLGQPGMNDSRAFFARLHQRLDAGPLEALRGAVREVQERKFPYSSITVLLTDGKALYAAREVREHEKEYTLRWTERAGRLVLCQEPVFDAEWQDVPNGHLAVATARGVETMPL